MLPLEKIRNFCIIAHIDHGKSTLADRFLEITNTISGREMTHGQMLDTMDIEQERGITIKLQPVRMNFKYKENEYILNLIDTPGHVDFSYEVSRSLAACEGAILLIDASQGIQAQTLANCYLALENDLEIIPVLNKIDLPSADIEKCKHEIENVLGIDTSDIISVSAKEGTNIEKVLIQVIEKIPAPKAKKGNENKALIFDSVYDSYKGILAYVRVFEGSFKKGDKVLFLNTDAEAEILEVGYFKPKYQPAEILRTGEAGYIVTGLKTLNEARVGDTIWSIRDDEVSKSHIYKRFTPIPLPGYKRVNPVVFAGVFCTYGNDYPLLKNALEKLNLNDSALSFEPEQSGALGHGFRCGFLGLLHMEIVQERLEREYDLDLIFTSPSVSYIVVKIDNTEEKIENPTFFPEPTSILEIKEHWVRLEIITPKDYTGSIMQLVQEERGIHKSMEYIDLTRILLIYEIPLSSIIIDFYDRLKSITSGYASMNYEFLAYREGDLVKLDILVAGDKIEAFSNIIYRGNADYFGRYVVKKLKELLPKQMFEIPIQAAVGTKILARETISAFRKDVTAKLYGGDRSRKDKLLKKQKEGKKRMKTFGKVDIPQRAFLEILKRGES